MRKPCKTLYVRRGEQIMVCRCHYGTHPTLIKRGKVQHIWTA